MQGPNTGQSHRLPWAAVMAPPPALCPRPLSRPLELAPRSSWASLSLVILRLLEHEAVVSRNSPCRTVTVFIRPVYASLARNMQLRIVRLRASHWGQCIPSQVAAFPTGPDTACHCHVCGCGRDLGTWRGSRFHVNPHPLRGSVHRSVWFSLSPVMLSWHLL